MSYSQIKETLGISKSTLSGWLSDMPLTDSRIRELRDNNQIRIEKTRETKRLKKETRRNVVLAKVALDIESSKDPCFVSGFYLYWGEGTKSAEYTVALTNSDPSMIRCFIEWLVQLGVSRDNMKVKLHLYTDQEEKQLVKFWAGVTNVPRKNFYKSYIKQASADRKTYKGLFPYGTCAVFYNDRDVYEYVLAGVKYLRNRYSLPSGII
jgi:hypothetical protein